MRSPHAADRAAQDAAAALSDHLDTARGAGKLAIVEPIRRPV